MQEQTLHANARYVTSASAFTSPCKCSRLTMRRRVGAERIALIEERTDVLKARAETRCHSQLNAYTYSRQPAEVTQQITRPVTSARDSTAASASFGTYSSACASQTHISLKHCEKLPTYRRLFQWQLPAGMRLLSRQCGEENHSTHQDLLGKERLYRTGAWIHTHTHKHTRMHTLMHIRKHIHTKWTIS
jgi:hypothetical protein